MGERERERERKEPRRLQMGTCQDTDIIVLPYWDVSAWKFWKSSPISKCNQVKGNSEEMCMKYAELSEVGFRFQCHHDDGEICFARPDLMSCGREKAEYMVCGKMKICA